MKSNPIPTWPSPHASVGVDANVNSHQNPAAAANGCDRDQSFSSRGAGTGPLFRWLHRGLLAVMAILALPLPAQSPGTGIIEGRVSIGAQGEYVGNVRVAVQGTAREAVTEADGSFRITGVPAGTATVVASYVGSDARAESVAVEAGKVAQIDFVLQRSGVIAMEAFEVLEKREQDAQALAMNQQRQSPNIKNVVAFNEFPTGVDGDIGEFLRFIPGLSVLYSGRTGEFASYRGMPASTSGITLDGVELSGTFTDSTRAVNLVAVPTNNIATIEVTKVPTPDMSAHGLGGALNVTTRSGFERSKPLFEYNVFTSFDPQYGLSLSERPGVYSDQDARHIRPSFELNYIRPVNKSLSITLSAAYKLNYNTNPDDAAVTWDLIKGFQGTATANHFTQVVTIRSGLLGVDWKLNDKNIFKASINYRGRDQYQGTAGLAINYGSGATGTPSRTVGAPTGTGAMSQSNANRYFLGATTHALLKYTHLGDVWRVDASGSYSNSWLDQNPDYEREGVFSAAGVVMRNLIIEGEGQNGAADRAAGLLPSRLSVRDLAGNAVSPFDGRLFSIENASVVDAGNSMDKYQARVDLRREMAIPIPFTLQVGGAVLQSVQEVWNRGKSYTFRPGTSAAERMAGNYDLMNTSYNQVAPEKMGGRLQMVSADRLFELFRERPDYFVLNETAAHRTVVNSSKKLDETISAAYIRTDTRLLNNRLWVVAGVRYEHTNDKGWGPLVDPTAQYVKNADGSLAKDAAGKFIPLSSDPVVRERFIYTERGSYDKTTYDGFFPSLNATYNITDDLLLRIGAARTIGRPELEYIIPGVSYSAITETSLQQTITVVNTALKPWMANNYDLSLESYLFKGGFGSIGVFQKDLSNFFTTTSITGTAELLEQYGLVAGAGQDALYEIRTQGNGGDARVRGLEFTYRQSLGFLPNWARGIQVFANYTRSDLSGSSTADFTGFAPETLSWGVNLIRPRYTIKFSSAESEETKRRSVGASASIPPNTWQYQGALKRWTLSAEYNITPHVGIYASLNDFREKGGYTIVQKRYVESTPAELRTNRITEWGMGLIVGIKGSF